MTPEQRQARRAKWRANAQVRRAEREANKAARKAKVRALLDSTDLDERMLQAVCKVVARMTDEGKQNAAEVATEALVKGAVMTAAISSGWAQVLPAAALSEAVADVAGDIVDNAMEWAYELAVLNDGDPTTNPPSA